MLAQDAAPALRVPAVRVGVVEVSRNVLASNVPAVLVNAVAVTALPRVAVPLALFIVKVGKVTPFSILMVCAPVPLKVKLLPVSTKLPPANDAVFVRVPAIPTDPLIVILFAP